MRLHAGQLITVRVGDATITFSAIEGEDEAAVRGQIANMAATIAAGIESAPWTSESQEWSAEDTVRRSLRIAVDIFTATRSA